MLSLYSFPFLPVGGYYAVEVSSKIVMLALNTILYYPPDHEGTELDDPSGQLDWMEKQLKYYRKANNKVRLILSSL